MNKFMQKFAFLSFLLLLLTITVIAGVSNEVENDVVEAEFIITGGSYGDYDGDGDEDDVIVTFDLEFEMEQDGWDSYRLHFSDRLAMPSGYTFTYYDYIDLYEEEVERSYTIIYCGHALESGWYTITLAFWLEIGGYDYAEASLTFDPPGGAGGGGMSRAMF